MAIAKSPKRTPKAAAPAAKPAIVAAAEAAAPAAKSEAAAAVEPVAVPAVLDADVPLAAPIAAPAAAPIAAPAAAPVAAAAPAAAALPAVVPSLPVKTVQTAKLPVLSPAGAGEQVSKGLGQMLDFNQANVAALLASGTNMAHGLTELAEEVIHLTHDTLDKSLSAAQALAAVKTVQEAIDLSKIMTQASLDKILADGNHLTSLSTKLLEDSARPLQLRFSAALQSVSLPNG